jgi:hypothetical protein
VNEKNRALAVKTANVIVIVANDENALVNENANVVVIVN